MNYDIRIPQVRVIGSDGEMIGVMPTKEAIRKAQDEGLDLVEISPNVAPPVCKILDFGKFKYEIQKKRQEAKKKQKVIDVKEIQMRPNIDSNDYQVKLRNAKRFLEEGDKVKVVLRFQGREMAYQDINSSVILKMKADLESISKVDQEPKLEGRQMIMVLSSSVK